MNNKTAGAYVDLVKALNRLEDAGEMPLFDQGFEAVGVTASVVRDADTGRWRIVEPS